MRILLAFLFVTSVAHAGARLPTTVVPSRYAITLEPDLAKSTFAGQETIDVTVKAAARTITLHAIELHINDASVQVGGERWAATVAYDAKAQTATLTLPKDVPAGPAQLRLGFTGILNDKLHGFYAAESDGRRFAFTQFEATDARRAFPAFDEPAYKARFQVTAVIDPADRAVSNGAIVDEKLDPARKKKVVRFAETLPMSSYLVALAVGPLVDAAASTRAGRAPIHVWTPPGKEKLAGFALHEAEALLDKLGAYFGIPYPYGKLDLVAVPDFAAGAMENTGAIFFRETALLVDEKTASTEHRHNVSLVVAHEMAHQWFGDLVTMQWWDDLWLNEAFATWMENKVVDQVHPDWHIWLDFESSKSHAMGLDALQATHPIRTPVSTPEEANEQFDAITYSKGSGVLRMLESWLGEAAFRKGVGDYLRAHAHGNAVAADLWQALGAASNQPVTKVASSWLDQPGFPVVTVEASCSDGRTTLKLAQERFLAGAGAAPKPAQTWMIPVCARSAAGTECTLFDAPTGTLALKAPGCGWVDANARHAGFFRVNYTPAQLTGLGRVAESQLDAPERIGLVDDAWSLVRKGSSPLTAWLDLVAQLQGEPTPEVNDAIAHGLAFVDEYLVEERDRPLLAQFVEELFRPVLSRLGWDPRAGESDAQRTLRGTALETMGHVARSKEVLGEAQKRLPGYLANPASVDGTVGSALVKLNAIAGSPAVYDQFLSRMRSSKEPEERARLLYGLAAFESPPLVHRTLELMLSKDVRVQDVMRVLGTLLRNKPTRLATWQFVKTNYGALKQKAPTYGFDRLIGATGAFCDDGSQKDIYTFFKDPAHPIESERSLKQSQESIGLCTQFRARETGNLSGWLRSRTNKQHAAN